MSAVGVTRGIINYRIRYSISSPLDVAAACASCSCASPARHHSARRDGRLRMLSGGSSAAAFEQQRFRARVANPGENAAWRERSANVLAPVAAAAAAATALQLTLFCVDAHASACEERGSTARHYPRNSQN